MASLTAQVAEVKREIALRLQVYPGLVFSRKMKQEAADIHTANMRAVLETLDRLRDFPLLFGAYRNAHALVVVDESEDQKHTRCIMAVVRAAITGEI